MLAIWSLVPLPFLKPAWTSGSSRFTYLPSLQCPILLSVCYDSCPFIDIQFSSVQSLSCVWLFATPWIAAHQASLFITNSWSLLKLMSTELVMLSNRLNYLNSVQFSSVAQSCLTLCNPMNRSTPGLPVHHKLPEFTQTHVHRVSDTIQPSHPLSSPSPPGPNPSHHQSLFQWVNSSHEGAKVLEFQL